MALANSDAEHDAEQDNVHPQAAWPNIQIFPVRHTKVIHFIRHGQGFHNVAGHKDTAEYLKWEHEDAHLTELGWKQAHALREHIAGQPEKLEVEAVIVSPLSRTMQTAVGAFGAPAGENGGAAAPLMIAQQGVPEKQIEHPAVCSSGAPPFIAWEHCREHLGLHPCDRRRSLTFLKEQYPAVDFSLIETEEDELWQEKSRETHKQIRARGRKFVAWLLARPERRLAVVTHSSFLFFLLSNYGHQAAPPVQGELHRWYDNCEMRTVVLADSSGESGGLDPRWFPGGHRLGRLDAPPDSNGAAHAAN